MRNASDAIAVINIKFGVCRKTGADGLCIGNGSSGSDMVGSGVVKVEDIFWVPCSRTGGGEAETSVIRSIQKHGPPFRGLGIADELTKD